MYTFTETILCSNKELQRLWWSTLPLMENLHWKTGGPYYPKYDLYNDRAIFNNPSPLQLNEYLYQVVCEFGFCLAQNFINCCSHLHYFSNLIWKIFFHATF